MWQKLFIYIICGESWLLTHIEFLFFISKLILIIIIIYYNYRNTLILLKEANIIIRMKCTYVEKQWLIECYFYTHRYSVAHLFFIMMINTSLIYINMMVLRVQSLGIHIFCYRTQMYEPSHGRPKSAIKNVQLRMNYF